MVNKKTRNFLLAAFGTLALAVGFGSTINSQRNMAATNAVAIPASTELYLKPSSNWLEAGARFAAYFFNNNDDNEWKDFVKEAGVLDIYKVVAPTTAYQGAIFCRMNPGTTINNWDNKWSQTPNLVYDSINNLYTVVGWDSGGWSVYDPEDHPLPPPFAADLKLYFKPSGEFMTGATSMAAYYFVDGGLENVWVAMTEDDTNIYEAVTPSLVGKEYDRVIFVSLKDTVDPTPLLHWDNKISQTGNLIHEEGKYLFDNATSTWGTYTPREEVTLTDTVAGINNDKVRIWLDRSGHYEEGYSFALKIGTTRYKPTGFEKALKLYSDDPVPVQFDRFFVYYDMPVSALTGSIGISIVSTPGNKLHVEIPVVAYTAGDSNKLWKVSYDEGLDTWSYSKGAITDRIYNTFFAKVLEGYLTCSDSAVNGYMAFNDFDSNFLPKAESVWNMEGDLSGNLIADYESQANYASGTRESTASTDAYAKYVYMQALYAEYSSSTQNIGYLNNNNAIALIIGIALIGLTSIAGLYVLKRKRV